MQSKVGHYFLAITKAKRASARVTPPTSPIFVTGAFGYSKVLAAWKLAGKFLAKGS